jgi:hypothetical protein
MPLIKEASPKQKIKLLNLLSEAKKKLVKNQIVIKENLDYLEEK